MGGTGGGRGREGKSPPLSICSVPRTAAALKRGPPRHSQEPQSLWVLVPCVFPGEHAVRGRPPPLETLGGCTASRLQELRTGAVLPGPTGHSSAGRRAVWLPPAWWGLAYYGGSGAKPTLFPRPPLSDTPAHGESSKPS